MLKGAQKRMIVIKTANSRLFEEAYFVMRGEASATEGDMVAEANRIIENCGGKKKDKRARAANSVIIPICMFMGGGFAGSVIAAAVMLISG